jgi:arylsulfatase A-like enzyme
VGLNAEEVTLAELLKARGYATACVGKWHLGFQQQFLPTRHGFDTYLGIPYSNDMSLGANMTFAPDAKLPPGVTAEQLKGGDKRNHLVPLLRDEQVIEYPVDQTTLTERYTEEAVKFITANKDKPFFLYLPHSMPHVPLHVSERFKGKSQGGLYGDVIECIDWGVGQVLDAIRKFGIDEQTLVLFTSDNGPWLVMKANGGSALPLREGKGTTWEGGMRVPCIVRWPGRVPAGKACSEMVLSLDVLPTFARLAGASVPTDRVIDGKDVWPLLSGQDGAKTPHEAFFYCRGERLEAVRSGPWKLHLARREGPPGTKPKAVDVPVQLYDLQADIGETRNVAAEHPDVVQRLTALAEQFRADLLTQKRPPGKA